jgi:hypothetical protein
MSATQKSLMPSLRSPAYGNYVVHHPDGHEMFRCTSEKAWWYLSRGLAEIMSEDTDLIRVKLNFVPKGRGHHGDEFYLGPRENKCVVCAEAQNLTRHHIVPYNYRRVMPIEGKSRNYHDVVLLCDPCHRKYEEFARDLKMELAEKYHAPLSGKGDCVDFKRHKAKKAASAIEMFRDRLPENVLRQKTEEIAEYLGHEPSPQEIADLSVALIHDMTNHKRHGEIVISQVKDIQSFVEMWRFHFISVMHPKHMPKHWDAKRLWCDIGHGRKCTDTR